MTENPAEKAIEDQLKAMGLTRNSNTEPLVVFALFAIKRFSEDERHIEKEHILKKIEEKIQKRREFLMDFGGEDMLRVNELDWVLGFLQE